MVNLISRRLIIVFVSSPGEVPPLPTACSSQSGTNQKMLVTPPPGGNYTQLKKLKALSAAALHAYFPGKDPLAVANEIEKHRISKLKSPVKLTLLCNSILKLKYTDDNIEKGMEYLRQLKSGDCKKIGEEVLPAVTSENKLNRYLEALALKRKVSVVIPKLSTEVIQLKTKTHWSDIDPYSSLEECLSDEETKLVDNTAKRECEPTGLFFDSVGGHTLRKRKRNYIACRPRRNTSKDKFYRNMCEDITTNKKKKPSTKTKNAGLSVPSVDRIKAQNRITDSNNRKKQGLTDEVKLRQTYKMFQPIRSSMDHDDADNLPDSDPKYDSDDTVILKQDVKSVEQPKNELLDTPVKEFGVKTKTFGIRKPVVKVKVRMYRCPTCKAKFDKVAKLNKHYKDKHSPLCCKDCDAEFTTPSSLERHSYKHRDLKLQMWHLWARFPFRQ